MQPKIPLSISTKNAVQGLKFSGLEDLPSSEPAIGRSPAILAADGLAQTKANPIPAFVGEVGRERYAAILTCSFH